MQSSAYQKLNSPAKCKNLIIVVSGRFIEASTAPCICNSYARGQGLFTAIMSKATCANYYITMHIFDWSSAVSLTCSWCACSAKHCNQQRRQPAIEEWAMSTHVQAWLQLHNCYGSYCNCPHPHLVLWSASRVQIPELNSCNSWIWAGVSWFISEQAHQEHVRYNNNGNKDRYDSRYDIIPGNALVWI